VNLVRLDNATYKNRMTNSEASDREGSVMLRYGGVTALVLVAFTLATLLAQHFVPTAASLFICTIMLSSWLGGAGPGFWAAVLSIALFKYGFVFPIHSLRISSIDLPRIVLFSCTTLFVGSIGALQNRTAKSLRQAHRVLERTVVILTETNAALQTENAEHLRVAEQLRLSEAFLAEGEKISHTGSWRWSIAERQLVWSDEHYRIFGYPPHAAGFNPDSVRDLIHPDDLPHLRDTMQHAIEAHSAFECEYRILLQDGSVRHVFGTGRPIPSNGEPVAEYIGTTVDISARKHTEELLRKSVMESKEAERRVEESRQLIQQLADRSEAVREDERKHLARELHDSLAQSLLALRLQIGVIGLQFGKDSPALPLRIKGMVEHVDESIRIVRNAIASLRPVALDLGAIAAVEWLVEQFISETEIPCEFHAHVPTITLPDKQTTALFRIAQEALRNIARHARATHVRIDLDFVDDHYLLKIRDNGNGFDMSFRKPKSFGLVGIQERAAMFKGVCDIATAPGQGTFLCVRMPVLLSSELA
jgi:PAS domain S-box-containing protein